MNKEMDKTELVLKKYSRKFKQIFGVELRYFVNPLLARIGFYDFDIVAFDDWLHKKGYTEYEHGSIKDYVILKYGEGVAEFLMKVMDMEEDNNE